MTPVPSYSQPVENEEIHSFHLEPVSPDNLSSRLAEIFETFKTADQPILLRRQHWIQAAFHLLSKADLLEEGESGNPSCHPVLKIGHIYLADAYPDALSPPGQQLSPVACARLIKEQALTLEDEALFEIARVLKQRYAHSIRHNSMAHFIYPLIDKLLHELHLNPHVLQTWDQFSDTKTLKMLSCMLCFDLLTSCAVLPDQQLEFTFPHTSLRLDFTQPHLPNELMSYGSAEEEFLVMQEPFELASYFSLLSQEQKQQWRNHLQFQTLPSGAMKEMLLHMSELILRRYLTPYLLARKPPVDLPCINEPIQNNDALFMTEREFLKKILAKFNIGRTTATGTGNCFLTACVAQFSLLSRLQWGLSETQRIQNLRQAITRYYEEHQEELANFIPARYRPSFTEEIRGQGWTGEDVIIHITALVLNRPIYLYNTFGSYHYLDTTGHLKPDKIYHQESRRRPLYILGNTHFAPLLPKKNLLPLIRFK